MSGVIIITCVTLQFDISRGTMLNRSCDSGNIWSGYVLADAPQMEDDLLDDPGSENLVRDRGHAKGKITGPRIVIEPA